VATIYYEKDVNKDMIRDQKVGVIGYGSQGHAQALNLRDSGVQVQVGLRPDSSSRSEAASEGLEVGSVSDVSEWADVIMMLAPDTAQASIFEASVAPNLTPGKTLMFSHGFNIHFGTIQPPQEVDVSMVAPKAPGHRLRETYVEGEGTPALLAVHQDASGQALERAVAYAWGIGSTRAGVILTTFAEETETDLFGEQAVLCGGLSALVKAGFETLVKAGYQPEIAYFECMHELKLIVDLMYRGGLNYMRYSVSDTAEHGDYSAGPRLITEQTIGEMNEILKGIRDGSYAQSWIDEDANGRAWFQEQQKREQEHPIEKVGAELRSMMPFLDPVTVTAEDE
jgi:ketol-acid reductoisomerase